MLADVFNVLNKLKTEGLILDYAIAGGQAKNYYLEPTYTKDIDILILADIEEEDDTLLSQFTSNLYEYLRSWGHTWEGVNVIIHGFLVQFIVGSEGCLFGEAIKNARNIRIDNIPAKVVTVEYLIAMLLMSFRLKDKMAIADLLELADLNLLRNIVEEFDDETNTLQSRLQKILEAV